MNPEDPTKYDYVLSKASIIGYCAKDLARSQCCLCPIASVCASSRLPKPARARPLAKEEVEILRKYLEVYGKELDMVVTEYHWGGTRRML